MTADGEGDDLREKTTNLLLSDKDAETVFNTLKHDQELQDPAEVFYNGECYFCPDNRCKTRGSEPEDIRFHVDQTHDRSLREHFVKHYNDIVLARRAWVHHEELLEQYQEELEEEVMELEEFNRRFEHGMAVCAICQEPCEKARAARKHKNQSGHNIWYRRLETPEGYEDPKVSN